MRRSFVCAAVVELLRPKLLRCSHLSYHFRAHSFKNSNSSVVDDNLRSVLLDKARNAPNSTLMEIQINSFYIPLFDELFSIFNANPNRTLFMGLSALQGCGKTTMTDYLKCMFQHFGYNCISISLDDFYITNAEQQALAVSTNNPLLRYRGNAGTHAVDLLLFTLRSAQRLRDAEELRVPQYDKTLHDGRGDRVPLEQYLSVTGPIHVVLLEGWMLGFQPWRSQETCNSTHDIAQTASSSGRSSSRSSSGLTSSCLVDLSESPLAAIHPGLPEVNAYLESYQSINDMMDMWIVMGLQGCDSSSVGSSEDGTPGDGSYDQRSTASGIEGDSESENGTGRLRSAFDMTRLEEQVYRLKPSLAMLADQHSQIPRCWIVLYTVRDFVERFMPAYKAYLPALYSNGPTTEEGKDVHVLKIMVDERRNPVTVMERDLHSSKFVELVFDIRTKGDTIDASISKEKVHAQLKVQFAFLR